MDAMDARMAPMLSPVTTRQTASITMSCALAAASMPVAIRDMAISTTLRRPIISATGPISMDPKAVPSRLAVSTMPSAPSFNPHSWAMTGAA